MTFYERDEELVASVVDFLAEAMEDGAVAIAVATATHLPAIESGVRRRVGAATCRAAFVGLDATELLERFLVDGEVDGDRFRFELDRLVAGSGHGPSRPLAVFGEMVAVLWERGDVTGAMDLEDRWNEVIAERGLRLLCGYPLGYFPDPSEGDELEAVCARHTSIVPGHLGLAAVERDALKRRQTELEDELEHHRELDRLRNQFTAMVVHDIKSPASIAASYLEVLLEDWRTFEPAMAQQLAERALRNVRRIQRLARDILTISQLDAGEFTYDLRPTDLGELVQRTVKEMQDATGRGIEVEIEDGLRPALTDEDRQVQVLTNILSNAVKFSPDHSEVHVSVVDDGQDLVVTVTDHGVGISPADREALFRPFLRGDNGVGGHGTGLGLSIAKALVEGQGGTLEVSSEVEVGTIVTYTVLPAS